MNFAERVKIRELTPFDILFSVATPNYCFDLSTTVIGDLCVFSASCSPFSLKFMYLAFTRMPGESYCRRDVPQVEFMYLVFTRIQGELP